MERRINYKYEVSIEILHAAAFYVDTASLTQGTLITNVEKQIRLYFMLSEVLVRRVNKYNDVHTN